MVEFRVHETRNIDVRLKLEVIIVPEDKIDKFIPELLRMCTTPIFIVVQKKDGFLSLLKQQVQVKLPETCGIVCDIPPDDLVPIHALNECVRTGTEVTHYLKPIVHDSQFDKTPIYIQIEVTVVPIFVDQLKQKTVQDILCTIESIGDISIRDYLKGMNSFKSESPVRVGDKDYVFKINMSYDIYQKLIQRWGQMSEAIADIMGKVVDDSHD